MTAVTPPRPQPGAVFAACFLLAGLGAVRVLAAVGALFAVPEFDRYFSELRGEEFAGRLAGLGLVGLAMVSLLGALVFGTLAILTARGSNAARIVTWAVTALTVCLNVAALAVGVYDAMPWYRRMSVIVVVATLVMATGVAALLALPASNAYFRRPRSAQPAPLVAQSYPAQPPAAVHTHSRAPAAVAVMILLTLLLAIIALPTVEQARPQVVQPDYTALLSGQVVSGSEPVSDGRGRLEGPHFSLEIRAVAVRRTLGKRDADAMRLESPLQAAEGHELLFAEVAPPPWRPRQRGTLAAAVVVDGVPRPLAAVPDPLHVLVVSVPKGASVLLRVTDEGRNLTMDLRDGSVPPDSIYSVRVSDDLTPETYTGTGTISSLTGTRPVEVKLDVPFPAYLDPFIPDRGWAKPGRSWLLLPGVQVRSDAWVPRQPGSFGARFDLDPGASFVLILADGSAVRPEPGPPVSTFGITDGFSVAFDVSDTFRNGTLKITPTGLVTAEFKEGIFPARWSTPPQDAYIPITMR